jgi:antitoxin VapB
MALNIKDAIVEQLAADVTQLAGETRTQAVRVALEERRDRLLAAKGVDLDRGTRLRRFLELEAWPVTVPAGPRPAMRKAEREDILGYGPDGM